jgi:hypothetical protein
VRACEDCKGLDRSLQAVKTFGSRFHSLIVGDFGLLRLRPFKCLWFSSRYTIPKIKTRTRCQIERGINDYGCL